MRNYSRARPTTQPMRRDLTFILSVLHIPALIFRPTKKQGAKQSRTCPLRTTMRSPLHWTVCCTDLSRSARMRSGRRSWCALPTLSVWTICLVPRSPSTYWTRNDYNLDRQPYTARGDVVSLLASGSEPTVRAEFSDI